MTESEVPKEEVLLCGCDVLVGFLEDGKVGDAVTLTRWTGMSGFVGQFGFASPLITRNFGKGHRKIGSRINRTLKTCLLMVGVNPKVVGITAELIFGAIETLVLAEVLGR
jgi:ribosomal protein L3